MHFKINFRILIYFFLHRTIMSEVELGADVLEHLRSSDFAVSGLETLLSHIRGMSGHLWIW